MHPAVRIPDPRPDGPGSSKASGTSLGSPPAAGAPALYLAGHAADSPWYVALASAMALDIEGTHPGCADATAPADVADAATAARSVLARATAQGWPTSARGLALADMVGGVLQLMDGALVPGLHQAHAALLRHGRCGGMAPAWACAAIGQGLGQLGDAPSGLAWARRAVALAAGERHAAGLARAQQVLGNLLILRGNPAAAVEVLSEACAGAQKRAPRHAQAQLLNALAAAWLARAEAAHQPFDATSSAAAWSATANAWGSGVSQALGIAERALEAATQGHLPSAQARALAMQAEARLLLGDLRSAECLLQAAAARADGHFTAARVEVLRVLAALRAAQQQWLDARLALREGLALCHGESGEADEQRLLLQGQALEAAAGNARGQQAWATRLALLAQSRRQRKLPGAIPPAPG